MNKVILVISIFWLTTLLSCNRIDFTNPEDVVKAYRHLSVENDQKKLYEDFISSKSKEFLTRDEFIKTRNIPDSILKVVKVLDRNVFNFPLFPF